MKTGRQINADNIKQYYLNNGKTICQDQDDISISGYQPGDTSHLEQYAKKEWVEENFIEESEEILSTLNKAKNAVTEISSDQGSVYNGILTINTATNERYGVTILTDTIDNISNRAVTPAAIHDLKLQLRDVIGAKYTKPASGIPGSDIAENSIDQSKIQENCIVTSNLTNNVITTEKLANGSVTTAKLANNSVTNGKIANNSIDAFKIANESISERHLSNTLLLNLIKIPVEESVYIQRSDFESNISYSGVDDVIQYFGESFKLKSRQKIAVNVDTDYNSNFYVSILKDEGVANDPSLKYRSMGPCEYSFDGDMNIYIGVDESKLEDIEGVTYTIYDTLGSVLERVKVLENNNSNS